MKTNYQIALDLMEEARHAETIEGANMLTAQAQVYATLALVNATADGR